LKDSPLLAPFKKKAKIRMVRTAAGLLCMQTRSPNYASVHSKQLQLC
jgi:hypothetical protein